MATWYHESSPAWFRARKGLLTASAIKSLWPETPTGGKRRVTDEDYIAAYYNSLEVDLNNIISTGAAARGHILEPYAIEEYNLFAKTINRIDILLYHWDDIVIKASGSSPLGVSLDACDIPQPKDGVLFNKDDLPPITVVGEVKSYNAETHYKTLRTLYSGKICKERIQLATQMYVCESAQKGKIILYNPRLEQNALLLHTLERSSFTRDFEIISSIESRFAEFANTPLMRDRLGPSEEEILAEQHSLLKTRS